MELRVTETDPVNERPSVQEDSQSKECDANHDPEHGCVREDQDCDTDQRCDYPERSQGALLSSANAVDDERTSSRLVHDRRSTVSTCAV
jgi:hypothetical protein